MGGAGPAPGGSGVSPTVQPGLDPAPAASSAASADSCLIAPPAYLLAALHAPLRPPFALQSGGMLSAAARLQRNITHARGDYGGVRRRWIQDLRGGGGVSKRPPPGEEHSCWVTASFSPLRSVNTEVPLRVAGLTPPPTGSRSVQEPRDYRRNVRRFFGFRPEPGDPSVLDGPVLSALQMSGLFSSSREELKDESGESETSRRRSLLLSCLSSQLSLF